MGKTGEVAAKPASSADQRKKAAKIRQVLSGPGLPLDTAARDVLQDGFGFDFSRVRIHADADATESARLLGALAYTVGEHVVVGPGGHAPDSPAGRALLVHELAHVVQQSSAVISGAIAADERGEAAADAAAGQVVAGRRPVLAPTETALARAADPPPLASFEERSARLDRLLSYRVFLDWVITDEEATEAFRILRAMTDAEQRKAVRAIRVDRLIDNLPDRYSDELAALLAKAGGTKLVEEQLDILLRYGFLDWIGSVSRSEANSALRLLAALPPEQRDRVLGNLPRVRRKRLYEALAPEGQDAFQRMWDERVERMRAAAEALIRPIAPGDLYLLKVTLVEQQEQVEAFAPEGTVFYIDDSGYGFFAPFDIYIKVAGLKLAEAQDKIATELTKASGVKISAELKPRPPGQAVEELQRPPVRQQQPAPESAAAAPADPYADKAAEFLDIFKRAAEEQKKLSESSKNDPKAFKEWERNQEALNRR